MSRRKLPKPIIKPDYTPEGAQCSLCPYMALGGCSPVKPRTMPNSRFLVILDQPDPASVRHGELRNTAAHKLLERSLASCGASDVDYVYATACRRPEGAKDKDVESAIQSCKPRLEAELAQASPPVSDGQPERKWLLALGESAFRVSTGKLGGASAWLGSPVQGEAENVKVIPSFDPWYVGTAKGSRYAAVWVTHLDRYARLATGQLGDFQWPEIVVDEGPELLESMAKCAEFAESGGEVSVDIETRGLGLDSAISCIGLAWSDGACCIQLPTTDAFDSLLRRVLVSCRMVGQNLAAFDRRVLERAGYKLTPHWEDTMLAASILDPQLPKGLSFLASSEFHNEAWKAEHKVDVETGVMLGDIWGSTDPEVERERRIYCARDAYVTLLLWQRQRQRLLEYK